LVFQDTGGPGENSEITDGGYPPGKQWESVTQWGGNWKKTDRQ
jgi:hypothetical protein